MPTYTDNLITRVAMTGVSAMRGHQRELGAGFKALTGDIRGASQGLDRLDQHAGAMVGVGIGLSAAGAAALAYMRTAVTAAGVEEDAQNQLRAALENTGSIRAGLMKQFGAYASQIQDLTLYDDELILSTMAYGHNLGIQESQLKDAGRAAAGLAAKYRIDLQTAMMLLGRASQGQTQMLRRYGITLDDNLGPEEKFNELLRLGAENFGLAEAATRTASGAGIQWKNTVDDLNQSMGRGLVPIVRSVNRVLAPATKALTAASDATGGWAGGAVALAGVVALAGGACLTAAPGVLALKRLYDELAISSGRAAVGLTAAGNAATTAGVQSAAAAATGRGGMLGKLGGALGLGGRLNWKGLGKGLGIGTALSLAGGLASAQGAAGKTELEESGGQKGALRYTLGTVGGGALQGAAVGAMVGSILPGIGTAIGAVAGAAVGAVGTAIGKRKELRELADMRHKGPGSDKAGGPAEDHAARSAAGIEQLVDLMTKQNRIIAGGGDRARGYLSQADLRRMMYGALGKAIV